MNILTIKDYIDKYPNNKKYLHMFGLNPKLQATIF